MERSHIVSAPHAGRFTSHLDSLACVPFEFQVRIWNELGSMTPSQSQRLRGRVDFPFVSAVVLVCAYCLCYQLRKGLPLVFIQKLTQPMHLTPTCRRWCA